MVRSVREFPPGAVAPYPEADASDETLKDGTRVHLRPIRQDEGPRLLELYDRLSPESLYFRFFAVPDKDRSKAEYLARVDYVNRYALVAEAAGDLVGVARWERDLSAPTRAEVAWRPMSRRIAPVARIQTVDTNRGPFEQIFGLSNVTITTASAAGPLKIHGLERGLADRLADDLSLRTQIAGGDGT